jgi:hypothetical protein
MNGLRNSGTGSITYDEFSVSSAAAVKWKNAHIRNENKYTLKMIQFECGRCISSASYCFHL